jgi:hypothetical protein
MVLCPFAASGTKGGMNLEVSGDAARGSFFRRPDDLGIGRRLSLAFPS